MATEPPGPMLPRFFLFIFRLLLAAWILTGPWDSQD
jgi:hypothetical protein